MIGRTPPPDEVGARARELGTTAADRWPFLTDDCWAGSIDLVSGLGARDGVPIVPVEESSQEKVAAAYASLMEQFGISPDVALRFQPFGRGYWGDA